MLQNFLPDIPLVATALPTWLNSQEFAGLAKNTDGFVLQVHSLDPPDHPSGNFRLCDTDLAKKWVRKASKIGVNFRIALPTYSYIIAFDSSDTFIGLSAEGWKYDWPEDIQLVRADSNPIELSDLIRYWQQKPPPNCSGIIWYRLPNEKDDLNWTMDTLAKVMDGKRMQKKVDLRVVSKGSHIVEIIMHNIGDITIQPEKSIQIRWDAADLLAAEGYGGYILNKLDFSNLSFENTIRNSVEGMLPGSFRKVGWLRFSSTTTVEINPKDD